MRFILVILILFGSANALKASEIDSSEFVAKYNRGLDSVGIDIPKRIAYRIQCLNEAPKVGMSQNWIADKLVYYLGQDYARIGDFDNALEINRDLTLHYDTLNSYYDLVWCHVDRAVYHQNQQQYKLSLISLQNAEKLALKHNVNVCLIDIYDGFSSTYALIGDFKKAGYYVEKQGAELLSIPVNQVQELNIFYFFNLANYYNGVGENTNAIEAYSSCIEVAKQIGSRKGMHAMIRLSELHLKANQPQKAELILQDFLETYVKNDSLYKEAYLLSAYSLLGQVYQRLTRYKESLFWVNKAEALASYFHAEYQYTNSKFFIDEVRRANLELGVLVSKALFTENQNPIHIVDALLYADNAKSNVLNERLSITEKLRNTNSHRSTVAYWYDLHKRLYDYRSLGDIQSTNQISVQIDSLIKVTGLDRLSNFNASNLTETQSRLGRDAVIVEYSICEDRIFAFIIDRSQITIKDCGIYNPVKLRRFHEIISNPSSNLDKYLKSGFEIYTSLVAPCLEGRKEVAKLTIILDRALNYIPFDALPTDPKASNWGNVQYLMKNYVVTYDFSLATHSKSSTENYVLPYIGFAIDFSHKSNLPNLQSGVSRVINTANQLDGKTFINEEARSEQLITAQLRTNILHIHSHGLSSDSSYNSSYIHLYDKQLYVKEIMETPIRTNLCLLTACEVGLGKRYKGEGTTGVAWAFKVAGSDNVVQSLWKINETSTDRLTGYFFDNIQDEYKSDIALNLAKRQYLEDSELSNRLKHPYFWAGLAHFGAGYQPHKATNNVRFVLIIMGVVLISFLLIRRRLKHSNYKAGEI